MVLCQVLCSIKMCLRNERNLLFFYLQPCCRFAYSIIWTQSSIWIPRAKLRLLIQCLHMGVYKRIDKWVILLILALLVKSHLCKSRCAFLLQRYDVAMLFYFILHEVGPYEQFIQKLPKYKFIMIRITNLTLTITHPNTLYITNKELKFVAGISMYATKTTGKLLSEGNIKWDDIFVLPFYPIINFQIVTKHSFGFNPEQLEAVIQGNLILSEKTISKDVKTITANVTNLKGEKVGFLKVDIRQASKRPPSIFNSSQALTQSPKKQANQQLLSVENAETQRNNQKYLRITSIIAHVQEIKGKTIFLVFKSGANLIKTSDYTSKSGQIVYICEYELKKDNLSIQINAEIHQNQHGKSQFLSKATYIIDQTGKVSKKGELSDLTNKVIGEMFIQCKIRAKNNRKRDLNSLLQSHLQTSYINNDHSLNEALKSSSVAKKKVSIINSNNQIRFSKQKRFFGMLEDKKSDYISYQSGGTFQFKQTSNDRYYKGASIGRGSKVDFIHAIKANPGVGQYRLPSIWDRY